MSNRIIGRRVMAWIGPRNKDTGTIIRVDGLTRRLVCWDSDRVSEWYAAADLMRVTR